MNKETKRQRNDPQADAKNATAYQMLILRDSCALFDDGNNHQFLSMAVSLRTLCHQGSSGSLLNIIRENGRPFPSSVKRNFSDLHGAASDHFTVATDASGVNITMPRLDLTLAQMKTKKFKKWWAEIVVTDSRRRGLSRGNIVLAVANHDGGTHFTLEVDELYDDLARANGLGLFAEENGSWRSFGLAPIQCIIRQIAHEFLLGMSDWIALRQQDWAYQPKAQENIQLALLPGVKLEFSSVKP